MTHLKKGKKESDANIQYRGL